MRAIVFDLETTGLTLHPDAEKSKQPRMIEFGAAIVDETYGVHEKASMLINPETEITDEITKITGITNKELADAPPLGKVLPDILRLFQDSDVMVAHNLSFDLTVLQMEIERVAPECFVFDGWPDWQFCTVLEYMDMFGNKRPTLRDLYQTFSGKRLKQSHRALDDVMALVEVLTLDGFFPAIAEVIDRA